MLLTSCTCSIINYTKIKHPEIGQVFKFNIDFNFGGGYKPWLKPAIKFYISFNSNFGGGYIINFNMKFDIESHFGFNH